MSNIKQVIHCFPEIKLEIKKRIKLIAFQKEYRKANEHNGTVALNFFPIEKISVGQYTYGGIRYLTFDNPDEHLTIGNCCSIAENVTFIGGGEHNYKHAFLFPVYSHIGKHPPLEKTPTKGPIIVEDDVWIGYGSVILSGCTIGKGSVIGAGSVVSKDIPPFSIYVGNNVIKSRFDNPKIKDYLSQVQMLKLKEIPEGHLKEICSQELTEDNLKNFKEMLL